MCRLRIQHHGSGAVIHRRQFAYPCGTGPVQRFPDLDLLKGGVRMLQVPSGPGKSTWLALTAGLCR